MSLVYWAVYFLLYCLLLFVVTLLAKTYNIISLSATPLFPSKISKAAFYLSVLSFGGLPPFTGFIPK
jgi:NADH:ubiquinone oxidoreductase subunit 2 (subunit N)